MMESDNVDWVKVACSICGTTHLNSPDVSYPLCDDCFDDFYEDEQN